MATSYKTLKPYGTVLTIHSITDADKSIIKINKWRSNEQKFTNRQRCLSLSGAEHQNYEEDYQEKAGSVLSY